MPKKSVKRRKHTRSKSLLCQQTFDIFLDENLSDYIVQVLVTAYDADISLYRNAPATIQNEKRVLVALLNKNKKYIQYDYLSWSPLIQNPETLTAIMTEFDFSEWTDQYLDSFISKAKESFENAKMSEDVDFAHRLIQTNVKFIQCFGEKVRNNRRIVLEVLSLLKGEEVILDFLFKKKLSRFIFFDDEEIMSQALEIDPVYGALIGPTLAKNKAMVLKVFSAHRNVYGRYEQELLRNLYKRFDENLLNDEDVLVELYRLDLEYFIDHVYHPNKKIYTLPFLHRLATVKQKVERTLFNHNDYNIALIDYLQKKHHTDDVTSFNQSFKKDDYDLLADSMLTNDLHFFPFELLPTRVIYRVFEEYPDCFEKLKQLEQIKSKFYTIELFPKDEFLAAVPEDHLGIGSKDGDNRCFRWKKDKKGVIKDQSIHLQ